MKIKLIKTILFVLLAVPSLAWSHAGNTSASDIHACANNRQVRIVGVSGSCTAGEIALHWSITGPAGPTGATGPQGPQGEPGPKGEKGDPGTSNSAHFIGESYGGGIVFWVDAEGQHGLIVAKDDQNGGVPIQWGNGVEKLTGTTGDGIGAGAMNTALIVAAQINDTVGGNFAAKLAADYSVREDGVTACTGSLIETCYGDWYLPSITELNLLSKERPALGLVFIGSTHWSSTETSANGAKIKFLGNGIHGSQDKRGSHRVRAVRAF